MKNEAGNAGIAAPALDFRAEGQARFEALGWPDNSLESWRRAPPKRLRFDSFQPAAEAAAGEDREPELPEGFAARFVFSGGRFSGAKLSARARGLGLAWTRLGRAGAQPGAADELSAAARAAEDGLQARHYSELDHGLALSIPAGCELAGVVLVEFQESGLGVRTSPHLHVAAGAGSRAEVVALFASGEADRLVLNGGLTARLGAGSRLGLTVHQELGGASDFFLTGRTVIERDAALAFSEFHLGAALVKTALGFDLDGPGSSADLDGAFLAGPGRHVDLGTVQNHRAPRASSDALYKGAVAPGGRSVYQGLITVGRAAEKTDAYLSNKNLVLGPGARADSMPKLRIDTNDVRCTHGSTTGKLDPAQLFYLVSRGLPRREALMMMVSGFFDQVIAKAPAAYRDRLRGSFSRSLAGLDLGEA